MTVSSEVNSNRYVASGGQTVFAYGFRIIAKEHLAVWQNSTLLTLTTHYTVSNVGASGGGNVTLVTGATANDAITILRDVPLTQLVDYVENDAFPANSHEDGLDLGIMAQQQAQETQDRTLLLAPEITLSNITFPAPGALEVIRWNAAGTALETSSASIGGAVAESDYITNSIRYKDSTDVMANVVVGAEEVVARTSGEISTVGVSASQMLGRTSSSSIKGMTAAEVRTVTDTFTTGETIGLIIALG